MNSAISSWPIEPSDNRIALDHCDFDFVISGEQQAFPFFFVAFFERQLEVGVLGANRTARVRRKEGNSSSFDKTRV